MAAVFTLLLVINALLLIAGVVSIVAVTYFWVDVSSSWRESHLRMGIAVMRCVSALTTLLTRVPAPVEIQPVGWTAFGVGAFAWLLLELSQYQAEQQLKEDVGQLKKDLRDAKILNIESERQTLIRTAIMTHLRLVLHEKKARLEKAVLSRFRSRQSTKLIECLDPEEHIYRLLAGLALSMRSLHPSGEQAKALHANFRVGLYLPKDGFMVPWMGFDLRNGQYNPFTSYKKHPDRFKIDNEANPSHTVRCHRLNQTFIIPNTASAGIQFFDPSQGNYLKSLLAHPINGLIDQSGEVVRGALVVDCDQADYFSRNRPPGLGIAVERVWIEARTGIESDGSSSEGKGG